MSSRTSPSGRPPTSQDERLPAAQHSYNSRRANAERSNDTMPDGATAVDVNLTELAPRVDHAGYQCREVPIRPTPTAGNSPVPESNVLALIGAGVKVLLHEINQLERVGIDTSIPLPKVVVIGDQSAGKSSLIEAISEITVPRDSGTCTRCVMQINLVDEPNVSWHCNISLVTKYVYSPEIPRDSALYPWNECNQQSVTPFGTVKSKAKLEQVIRRAQIATLNPSRPPTAYIDAADDMSETAIQVPFSPNIISLEIVSPGLPNLSFFDLPGIISQSHDGRNDTVRLIKQLASSYVSQQNTIVLLAVPMESDIDNSLSSALLTEQGANDRVVGVLTKPDRLQSEDRVDAWKSVLRGQTFRMGHGYFVVKQPTQAELNQQITHVQARDLEEKFFASKLWTGRFGTGFKDQLGTRKLQTVLSNKLAELILRTLPSLHERVQAKLLEVDQKLAGLPEPPSNGLSIINRLIPDFVLAFKAKFESTGSRDLSEAWRATKDGLLESIVEDQRPKLIISTAIVSSPEATPRPTPTPTPKSGRSMAPKRIKELVEISDDDEPPKTPVKKRKGTRSTFKLPTPIKQEGTTKSIPNGLSYRDATRKRFTLTEIRTTLDAFNTSGIPLGVELKAVDNLILQTLENWDVPLERFIGQLTSALATTVEKVMQEQVHGWLATKLFTETRSATVDLLNRHLYEMRTQATRTLQLERTKPITINKDLITTYTDEARSVLSDRRLKERIREYLETDSDHPRHTERELNRNPELIGPDTYAREVDVMARVRAYYRIASIRFVDTVIQAVEVELFNNLRDGLGDTLTQALRVNEDNGFKYANELVADDPEREKRRQILSQKKSRLEQAGERLASMTATFQKKGMGL